MVLVVVMIVVAMVGLAGYRFAEWMILEQKAVQMDGDRLQLHQAVRSGEALVGWFVEQPREPQRQAGGLLENPDRFRGVLVLDDPVPAIRCRFSVVSPAPGGEPAAAVRFGLANESARLNLPALVAWDDRFPGAARQALLHLPGMTIEVADALLDWIDEDSVRREYGAESEDYVGLDGASVPRNGVPATLEELALVQGVTREMLYGRARAGDVLDEKPGDPSGADRGVSEPIEAGQATVEADVPWTSLLTLYSAERNTDPSGQLRIDLNDKDLASLHRRLLATLGRRWADFIVAYRQVGPHSGVPADRSDEEMTIDLGVASRFTLKSVLDLVDASVSVPGPTTGEAIVVGSPLTRDRLATTDDLTRLLDHTSIHGGERIEGRINLNEAHRSVLVGVPGMDEALLERIVAARRSPDESGAPRSRRYVTWPLMEGLLTLAEMKRVMPYLTAGGDVYRAEVIGFHDRPGPTDRVEVVIDASVRPSRVVYRKDLSAQGLGYPHDLLGADTQDADEDPTGRAEGGTAPPSRSAGPSVSVPRAPRAPLPATLPAPTS